MGYTDEVKNTVGAPVTMQRGYRADEKNSQVTLNKIPTAVQDLLSHAFQEVTAGIR